MDIPPEFFGFLIHKMGREPEPDDIEAFTPDEAMEIAWVLNDLLLPHRRTIAGVPYRVAAEPECDAAIAAFALRPNAATLSGMSADAWRVLADRHVGFLTVTAANKAAGNIGFFMLPRRFPAEDRLGALMLQFLLRFPRQHLPNPPRD